MQKPLDSPAPAVAAQLAAILTPASIVPVGRDHLDPIFLMEPAIERVRVVGLVTDIGRSTGSPTVHCSSFSSQRPAMAVRSYPGAAPGSNEFHLLGCL